MKRGWTKLPPIMERTLPDDIRAAMLVLAGGILGYFVVGADDPSLLLGGLIGVVVATIAANVLRLVIRRRRS